MKEHEWVDYFSRDVDKLLNGNLEIRRDNNFSEYEELLKLANTLIETDFSTESNAKDKIFRNLRFGQRKDFGFKKKEEIIMKRLFKQYRPGYIMGIGALITVLAITFIFPGTMEAVANNIANVFKVGKGVTIMQTDDNSHQQAPLLSDKQISKDSEESNSDSKVKNIIHNSIAEAQKAVDFKVLDPEYLPTGYSFKEASTTEFVGADIDGEEAKSTRYYLTVKFAGPEKDITVFYRLVNEETAYEYSTGNDIESVKINDVIGVWEETGRLIWEQESVTYHMNCTGIDKEEAIKIAESFK